MAFETHLVAIRWYQGNYDVVSSISAEINFAPLRREKRLFDVTENPGYVDEAAIVSHVEFPKYLYEESATRLRGPDGPSLCLSLDGFPR